MLLLSASLVLAGCATLRENAARDKEDLMIAAGFQPKVARTPEARARLESMKPLVMHNYYDNKTNSFMYVFPDPESCNCAYVGNQTQYSEYRKLSVQKEITDEKLQAEEWSEYPNL